MENTKQLIINGNLECFLKNIKIDKDIVYFTLSTSGLEEIIIPFNIKDVDVLLFPDPEYHYMEWERDNNGNYIRDMNICISQGKFKRVKFNLYIIAKEPYEQYYYSFARELILYHKLKFMHNLCKDL